MSKGKESFTLARMSDKRGSFEVLVDPDKALKYKMGEKLPISSILVYEEVYRDAKKGIRASSEELKRAFGTSNVAEVARRILDEGEIQVTADQRRKLIEDKRKQIIDFISKNTIDPRTNTPHPPQRVELAMKEVGVSIDPFVPAKEQAMKAIDRIKAVLPIKMGLVRLSVRLPAQHYGRSHGIVRGMGKVTGEKFLADGSWECEVEVAVGVQADLIDRLNKACGGNVEIKILE